MIGDGLRHQRFKYEKGFTLVEMAVGLVIVGFLISLAAAAFSSAASFAYRQKTMEDMSQIADAISIYAQKHMRVPCPANPLAAGPEPFGAEIGSGAGGLVFGACNAAGSEEGILPFATLGLPQSLARDRFGNFYTYRISPSSAEPPVLSSTRPINRWCMTRPHWNDGANYVALAKGAFCCGTFDGALGSISNPGGDIIISGSFGPLPGISRADAVAGDPGSTDVEYITSAAPVPTLANLSGTYPPIFPAYILVSHGENGSGAFNEVGVRNLAGLNAQETENADGNATFFAPDGASFLDPGGAATPLSRSDIDDIVFWETPAQIMGRIGAVSCVRP